MLNPSLILAGFFSCFFLALAPVHAADEGDRGNEGEMAAILKIREGMTGIVAYMATRPDLFPPRQPSNRVLTSAEKQEASDLWSRFRDYQLMREASWQCLDEERNGKPEDITRRATRYAAFLTRYRDALEFIRLADADPAVRIVLNEPVPEIGLPERGY
ncbi:MAG: hypothetical protein LBI31_07405, partial [Zoogloeaceae bacterium]|nr:hypothetical protein [Zoogloeaceae bacterium]